MLQLFCNFLKIFLYKGKRFRFVNFKPDTYKHIYQFIEALDKKVRKMKQ